MRLALRSLKNKLPSWWNVRAATEADFYRICTRERIRVVELPLRVSGFYMICGKRRFIAINSSLRGVRWLMVAFHELAHHFLHAPPEATTALFYGLKNSKQEFEAKAVAACALMPESMLRSMLAGEIEEAHDYTRKMVEFRLRVLELYGV